MYQRNRHWFGWTRNCWLPWSNQQLLVKLLIWSWKSAISCPTKLVTISLVHGCWWLCGIESTRTLMESYLPAILRSVIIIFFFSLPPPSFLLFLIHHTPPPSPSSTFTLLHLYAPPSSCSSTLTLLHLRAPPLLAFLFPTTFPSFLPPFLSQANPPFSSAVNVFLCAAVIAYAGEEDQGFICRGRGRFIPR